MCKILCEMAILLALAVHAVAGASIESPASVRLCIMDAEELKTESGTNQTARLTHELRATNADIVILTGVPDEDWLIRLGQDINVEYPFANIVEAEDKSHHLAMLAKIRPAAITLITNRTYNIRGHDGNQYALPVKRGFLHAVFKWDNYTLHLLGAHLKDRTTVEGFNQTDMRRYEARLLRYLATEIMTETPEANILILGNFNDSHGNAPIKDIYNRRFGVAKRLFDIRPQDEMGTAWTAWNEQSDEYERLDYAIASSWLLPEIIPDQTSIIDLPERTAKGGRRPLLVTLVPQDKLPWPQELLDVHYPNAIRK